MPRILDAEFVLLQDNIVNEICCISALQDREDLQIRWMEIIQQFILPVELYPGTSLGIQPLIFCHNHSSICDQPDRSDWRRQDTEPFWIKRSISHVEFLQAQKADEDLEKMMYTL